MERLLDPLLILLAFATVLDVCTWRATRRPTSGPEAPGAPRRRLRVQPRRA